MLIAIRNLRKKKDGQAMILAAVGMLVLAIGVLATVNLSHAVHERIMLQNNADATAYSLAAMEARAFNFFAFVNRAQVSHYVSAMSVQSWLAVIWFVDAALAGGAMFLSFVNMFVCGLCLVQPEVCALFQFLKPIYELIKKLHEQVHQLLTKADKFEKVIGGFVATFGDANKFYGMAEMTVKNSLLATIAFASATLPAITRENDPKARWWPMGAFASSLLNMESLRRAFDSASEPPNLPNNDATASDDVKRAQRAMTTVANATRYNDFVTNRSLGNLIGSVLPIPLPVNILATGQTKLIGDKERCGASGRCRKTARFGTECDHSGPSRGLMLGADEVISLGVELFGTSVEAGLGFDVVSVWAAQNKGPGSKGEHCTHGDIVPTLIPDPLCPGLESYIPIPITKCAGDYQNHPWNGIQPYIKFMPDSGDPDFNQPSVYVFLNKTPEDLGGQVYVQNFDLTIGSHTESLDTRVGTKPVVDILDQMKGLNAWSRAMVYYHRPSLRSPAQDAGPGGTLAETGNWAGSRGNWREHPNFFNPYWRVKLAPLGEKVSDLLGRIGITGPFADVLSKHFITH